MGLIRKTLSVGTVGVVKGSSKKQRVAKQTRDAVRDQTAQMIDGSLASAKLQAAIMGTPEARRAVLEHELSLMPRGMSRSIRDRQRAKQIEAELAGL